MVITTCPPNDWQLAGTPVKGRVCNTWQSTMRLSDWKGRRSLQIEIAEFHIAVAIYGIYGRESMGDGPFIDDLPVFIHVSFMVGYDFQIFPTWLTWPIGSCWVLLGISTSPFRSRPGRRSQDVLPSMAWKELASNLMELVEAKRNTMEPKTCWAPGSGRHAVSPKGLPFPFPSSITVKGSAEYGMTWHNIA